MLATSANEATPLFEQLRVGMTNQVDLIII